MQGSLRVFLVAIALGLGAGRGDLSGQDGPPDPRTRIAPWQHGRQGAVSVTFDDASVNQFRVAAPLLTERGMAGTFFLMTGAVRGSKYPARFIGRPAEDILRETATVPTNATNFRERLSAAPFLGFSGLIGLRTSAAPATPQTFNRVDAAYDRARAGELPPLPPGSYIYMDNAGTVIQEPARTEVEHPTWDDIRRHARAGHEMGSHTITHPRLDALDEANITFELEESRRELLEQVGARHTFSAEAPFGIEDERVMSYAYRVYPALRNRMPEPWLDELNRSSPRDPSASDRPYVQWQRGILTGTTDETMSSWIETARRDGRIWLVLTIHGVEGVGWEPVSRETLAGFFDELASSRGQLWVATFQDVTKYLRERMAASVTSVEEDGTIHVTLTHALDPALYDLPLTLETRVPDGWRRARVSQGRDVRTLPVVRRPSGAFVLHQARPNAESITIERGPSR
jgi:peptidoglycan/xylan/chitin deacetylase (PgdA/CDA1 family)